MILHDFDNQFFRMVTVALATTISRRVRWISRFTPTNDFPTGKRRVILPFYTSLTGEERFGLDAFIDDIAGTRVALNTDQFQRGDVILTNFGPRSEEFANPNQYLSKKCYINDNLKKIVSKVKAVPMNMNYDIEIKLASEIEVDKCGQKILDLIHNYYFFNFDYYGLKIDAVLVLPDDKTIEIPREILDLNASREKKIKFSLTIRTYYPIFRITTDDLEVCDNDGDIDWDKLDVPRPTTNFLESLKNYNASYGQMGYRGGTLTGVTYKDGTTGTTIDMTPEGLTEIKKVYYKAFYQTYQNLSYRKFTDADKQSLENFNVSPTEPEEPDL